MQKFTTVDLECAMRIVGIRLRREQSEICQQKVQTLTKQRTNTNTRTFCVTVRRLILRDSRWEKTQVRRNNWLPQLSCLQTSCDDPFWIIMQMFSNHVILQPDVVLTQSDGFFHLILKVIYSFNHTVYNRCHIYIFIFPFRKCLNV